MSAIGFKSSVLRTYLEWKYAILVNKIMFWGKRSLKNIHAQVHRFTDKILRLLPHLSSSSSLNGQSILLSHTLVRGIHLALFLHWWVFFPHGTWTLVQFVSSVLSPQWSCPSHTLRWAIHLPFLHWTWSAWQRWVLQTSTDSSSPWLQSSSPSHIQLCLRHRFSPRHLYSSVLHPAAVGRVVCFSMNILVIGGGVVEAEIRTKIWIKMVIKRTRNFAGPSTSKS